MEGQVRIYIEFLAVVVADRSKAVAALREAERQGMTIICMSDLPVRQTAAALRERDLLEYFDAIEPISHFIMQDTHVSPYYIATLKGDRRSVWSALQGRLSYNEPSTSSSDKDTPNGDS